MLQKEECIILLQKLASYSIGKPSLKNISLIISCILIVFCHLFRVQRENP